MTTLDEARKALADAVTSAGLTCLPYPPDNPAPPIALVDSVGVTFGTESGFGGTFCAPGLGSATVIALAQRHDREGAIAYLEGLLPPILAALQGVRGVQLRSATSGAAQIGGQDLPAVYVTVSFPL